MIKLLIIIFIGLALIPSLPFVYGSYVKWDVNSSAYDSIFLNKLLDSATPIATPQIAKQAKEINASVGLIDIRNAKFYDRKHIKNAVNIPQDKISSKILEDFPDKNTTIYIYDDNNDDSALVVVRYLRYLGYNNSFAIQEGINGWEKAGYEVITDRFAP